VNGVKGFRPVGKYRIECEQPGLGLLGLLLRQERRGSQQHDQKSGYQMYSLHLHLHRDLASSLYLIGAKESELSGALQAGTQIMSQAYMMRGILSKRDRSDNSSSD
jgi:hypothetical protein